MKLGASPDAVQQQIRARARDLKLTHGDDAGIGAAARQIAGELKVDVSVVASELAALFEKGPSGGSLARFSSTQVDRTPASQKPGGGARGIDLLSATKAMGSTKKWDPVARLPEQLQARLSDGDRAAIDEAIARIQKGVRDAKLEYVPVFGYLSLRTNNFAELGKKSQGDVVFGRDVVNAALPGYDVDVIASTVFRGTPEHPGAVAGLGKKDGATTPGVVLKVPLARAEELLAVLLAREMFAEGDLKDGVKDGRAVSNAMYKPNVVTVSLDDEKKTVPAFVFVTNDAGHKAVNQPGAFGDGPVGNGPVGNGPVGDASSGEAGLTVERMAYLFAAQGGFVNPEGKAFGGPAIDYWQNSYLAARKAANQPVNPKIAAAVELSRLHPQDAVVDRLLERTDKDAKLMVEALRLLFQGAATPLGLKHAQKDSTDGLVRKKQGTRGDDAPRLLLEKARELERAGKIALPSEATTKPDASSVKVE